MRLLGRRRSVTSCWPAEVTQVESLRKQGSFKAQWPSIRETTGPPSRDKGRWLRLKLAGVPERSKSHRVCLTILFWRAARDVKSSADTGRCARAATYGQTQAKDKQSWSGDGWYTRGKYAEREFRLGQKEHQGRDNYRERLKYAGTDCFTTWLKLKELLKSNHLQKNCFILMLICK